MSEPRTPTARKTLEQWFPGGGDGLDADELAAFTDDLTAIEDEAAAMERERLTPTPEELDAVCAHISAAGYASEAVEVFEAWTLERYGVVSSFTEAHSDPEPQP